MLQVIRGILTSFTQAVYRKFKGTGRVGETIAGTSYQHYGFCSVPLPGTEIITLQYGNNNVAIAENDGAGRPPVMAAGSVAIYLPSADSSDPKCLIYLSIDTATSKPQITISCDESVSIVTKNINLATTEAIDLSADTAVTAGTIGTKYALVNENWLAQKFASHVHNFPATGPGFPTTVPITTPGPLPETTVITKAN